MGPEGDSEALAGAVTEAARRCRSESSPARYGAALESLARSKMALAAAIGEALDAFFERRILSPQPDPNGPTNLGRELRTDVREETVRREEAA